MVLVRSDQPEIQLQALRTALSLSLGDRPADLLIATTGIGVLALAPGSEAERCLETLRRVGLGIGLDDPGRSSPAFHHAEVMPHGDFVGRLAKAEFVQVF